MPIRVQCQCGQSLNVPDQMAGKSGKCPKCSAVIKIPAASPAATQTATNPGTAKAKVDKPKTAVAAPSKKGMDDLLDQVGLVKKTGTFCPNCDAPLAQGAALCVKCGFHMESGKRLSEHESESSRQEFNNKHLNEAAVMMKREKELEKRTLASGMPWWVLLCILCLGVMTVVVGLVFVDGAKTGLQPESSFVGKIQRQSFLTVIAMLLAVNCTLVSVFAHFATVAHAFRVKPKHGWLSMFIPFYSAIFGLTQFSRIRGTVIAYWVAILIGIPSIIYAAIKLPSDFFQF